MSEVLMCADCFLEINYDELSFEDKHLNPKYSMTRVGVAGRPETKKTICRDCQFIWNNKVHEKLGVKYD